MSSYGNNVVSDNIFVKNTFINDNVNVFINAHTVAAADTEFDAAASFKSRFYTLNVNPATTPGPERSFTFKYNLSGSFRPSWYNQNNNESQLIIFAPETVNTSTKHYVVNVRRNTNAGEWTVSITNRDGTTNVDENVFLHVWLIGQIAV